MYEAEMLMAIEMIFHGLITAIIVSATIWLIIFVWSVIHIKNRNNMNKKKKLMWTLIIFFFGLFGMLIYMSKTKWNNKVW